MSHRLAGTIAVILAFTPPASAGDNSLPDGDWTLVKAHPALPDSRSGPLGISLEAARGSITGFAGCNGFSSVVAVQNGALSIRPQTRTAKVCRDERDDIEDAFLGMLHGTSSARMDGRFLVLEGRGKLTFRRQ